MERAGCIYWLPAPTISSAHANSSVPEAGHNHPVIVLESSGGLDTILLLTSFNGQSLSVRHPTRINNRAQYLPIHPSPPHPDTKELLYLSPGPPLRKASYIGLSKRHQVPTSALVHYDRKTKAKYRLTPQSWKLLLEKLDLPQTLLFNPPTPLFPPPAYPVRPTPHNMLPQSPVRVQSPPVVVPPVRFWNVEPLYNYGTVSASLAIASSNPYASAPIPQSAPQSVQVYGHHELPSHRSRMEERDSAECGPGVGFCVVAALLFCAWYWRANIWGIVAG
ncbi:hypothetical protein EJ05DRAFT_499029 [Pseudovirgaria hyperparasitica]|uniref:Uncharacterized protein n=1 Tax=Pseudovirgaria hyperparasitica TaxID=470096 RepID=A0A6A6WAF3_9PEZI|nr:uncharacterized protein EJ05DRAFT_499029 [Pseudovirgaria hyperparasitica]KAF2759838.1 hypothetical protein EJ05DRAFT_499029 [Pseudovirgaria hyperparasitica]